MNIARILYPVQVLGPGNRIGIWVCGCTRRCKGCSNPELWERRPEYEISPGNVFELIQKIAVSHPVDGFTITGGEPMDQAGDLSALIKRILPISNDILVYTGYRIAELCCKNSVEIDYLINHVAVLIDGEYIEELNNDCILRGSSNQHVHVLNEEFRDCYKEYFFKMRNQVQNFLSVDGVISVGIHRKGF